MNSRAALLLPLVLAACAPADPPDLARQADTVVAPTLLSQVGLYADLPTRTVAADLLAFEPTYPLWSDGAEKRRWLRLPPGTTIDTTDMDHWQLPVGAQLFKEFAQGGVVLETRLIERRSDHDYFFGAFLWRADGSDADLVPTGATNVLGTDHDVPSTSQCLRCHSGEPGRALGLSAVQLSRDGTGVTLASLAAGGLLSVPPPPSVDYRVPGAPEVAAALGVLHGNCGHCHNPNGTAFVSTDQVLRVSAGELTAESTKIYQTTIGVALDSFFDPTLQLRIAAGAPDLSAIVFRMGQRRLGVQMPPIATKHRDEVGWQAVKTWVSALPH